MKPMYRLKKEDVESVKKLLRIVNAEYTGCLNEYEKGVRDFAKEYLSSIERDVTTLYYVKGLTVQEIARRSDRNISTISRNITRGTGRAMQIIKLARAISPLKF